MRYRALITVLDFTLPLSQLLQVPDDGFGCQVVEGLAPQVLVALLPAAPLAEERADVEGDLPLHGLAAPQPLHHRLAGGTGRARGAPDGAEIPVLGLPVGGGLRLEGEGWMLGTFCRGTTTGLTTQLPSVPQKP